VSPALDPEVEGQEFETVVISLRRWIVGLGLGVLGGLLVAGQSRDVLAGFCVGWFLSLFSLDHLSATARRVAVNPVAPDSAKRLAYRTYLMRWVTTVAVIVVAVKLGAHPVPAVAALLLLQAAVMCRSITTLFRGLNPEERLSESDSTEEG
jgi:hypothetical protein